MSKECTKHQEESVVQLKSGGLKVTPARLSVLDVFKHAKKPLNVKELSKNFSCQNTDQVTLYRCVESLQNLGLLKKVYIDSSQTYYELSAQDHHHHLVCKTCGKIADIEGCDIKINQKHLLKGSGFAEVDDHSLEFFGTCNDCSKLK